MLLRVFGFAQRACGRDAIAASVPTTKHSLQVDAMQEVSDDSSPNMVLRWRKKATQLWIPRLLLASPWSDKCRCS